MEFAETQGDGVRPSLSRSAGIQGLPKAGREVAGLLCLMQAGRAEQGTGSETCLS
jgi:hypothetical protein